METVHSYQVPVETMYKFGQQLLIHVYRYVHNLTTYIQSDSISVKSKKMLVRVGLNRQLNRKTRARDSGAPTSLAHALYVFVGGARSV